MQGRLIIGAFLVAAFATPSIAAVEPPQRQGCQRGETPQQVQRVPQRQQWAQQQPRNKPQGCTITRTIPSVVDPTPTFLL